jgi:flagellar biosynthetic protein FliO
LGLISRTAKLCWNTALVWLMWAGTVWAETQPLGDLQYQEPASLTPPSMGGLLLRMVISLAVVIGLAIILAKLLQKNTLLSRQSTWARVVDQVNVGPNKRLALTEIFGKVYVLGVTDHGITTLLGEDDIDLSLVKQAFAEAESRKRIVPSYLHNPFVQTLESKIGELRKYYEDRRKDGSSR